MRATYDRKSLLAAFGMVAGVAPSRSPKPILQGIKIQACPEHGSTLMATDGEIGIRHRVLGGTVREVGAAILPTVKMQAILSTSSDAALYIEATADGIEIRGKHAKFKLPSEDPDAFPDVPKFEAEAYHSIDPLFLRGSIRRTIFATDVESTRYALGGVRVELDADGLVFVATDGRRLAKTRVVAVPPVPAPYSIGEPVVPVKALKLMDRCLGDTDVYARLAFGTAAAFLATEDAEIYTRLVEGRFPRYQDVFPATSEARIEMGVGELLSAVEQAAILTSDESRGVDFEFAGGALSLKTNAADVGSASVTLPVAYEGKPVGITFDPRYLTDALKVLDPASRVTAELIDGKSAAVFKTDDGYQYVIMPLTRDR